MNTDWHSPKDIPVPNTEVSHKYFFESVDVLLHLPGGVHAHGKYRKFKLNTITVEGWVDSKQDACKPIEWRYW